MAGRELRFTETADLNNGTVSVLLLQLTKALKTYRAIRASALEGCGQDAAVLLRVLFETCTLVQWLLQSETGKRAKMLAAHADIRELIMRREQAKTPGLEAIGESRIPPLEALIADWTCELGADTMETLSRHWSGLGGIQQTAQQIPGWATAYSSVFRGTSRPAHGTDLADHAVLSDGKPPVFKLLPGTDDGDRVLTVAALFLHTITTLLDEWLTLGMKEDLAALTLDRINRRRDAVQEQGGS